MYQNAQHESHCILCGKYANSLKDHICNNCIIDGDAIAESEHMSKVRQSIDTTVKIIKGDCHAESS